MQFTIEKTPFYDIVSTASGSVSPKNLPVLQQVLIKAKDGAITATCDDMESRIELRIPCADISKEGSVCINSRRLAEVIKHMPGDTVQIRASGDDAIIEAGTSKLIARGIPVFDFTPPRITLAEDPVLRVPQSVLAGAIKRCLPSVSSNGNSPHLSGVHFDLKGNLILVATDGRRVSFNDTGVRANSENSSVTIPTIPAQNLMHTLGESGEVEIGFTDHYARFTIPSGTFRVPILESSYPNWRAVVSAEPAGMTLNRKALLDALHRAVLVLDDTVPSASFEVSGGTLTISVSTKYGDSTEHVRVENSGGDVSCMANPRFVIEAAKVMDSDDVELSLPGKSPVLSLGHGTYQAIIMPMKPVEKK